VLKPTSLVVPSSSRQRIVWKNLRLRTRIYLATLLLIVGVGGLEIVSRAYWTLGRKVPASNTSRIWNAYYEELSKSGVEHAPTSRDHESYEVLLLGGSTIHMSINELNSRLVPVLESHTGRSVHVTDLAWYGRNSLDSRLKYEHFSDKRFDLVLVYDGFNDARMNNTKPGAFRADFSHDPRYSELRALSRHPEVGWFALPFTVEFVAISVSSRQLGMKAGTDLKWSSVAEARSPEGFEGNLEAIARTAAERGDPLVLMTFAYHIPENYSDEAYEAGQLDYGG
jgi:hypothetical protein